MVSLEPAKPYWPFILALLVVIGIYLFHLIVSPGVKPKRLVLNETIPTLAHPKTGILKEIEFGTLKVENKTISSKVTEYKTLRISHGWLRKEFKEFSVYAENDSHLELEFEVLDSNWYNPIWVKLNDQLVWSDRPKGKTMVQAGLKQGQNEILIGAGTSFRFWDPTYYKLKDFRVRVVTLKLKSQNLTFKIPEAKGLVPYGTLRFWVDQADNPVGPLLVELNGDLIYSAPLEKKRYVIDLTEPKIGKNAVKLSASANSFNLSHTLIRVNYRVSDSSQLIPFAITKREHEYLVSGMSKASLSFNVAQIKQGKLNIEINNKTVWTGHESDSLDVSDELRSGRNTLKLLVTKGVFSPKRLRLILE